MKLVPPAKAAKGPRPGWAATSVSAVEAAKCAHETSLVRRENSVAVKKPRTKTHPSKAANLRRAIRASVSFSFVEFEFDRADPREDGNRLSANQNRMNTHESDPQHYSFEIIKDGRELTFNFSLSDTDTDSAHSDRTTRAVKIKKTATQMEAQGVPRTVIADLHGVHKSTVTRALGPVKGKKKRDSSDDTNTGSEASE